MEPKTASVKISYSPEELELWRGNSHFRFIASSIVILFILLVVGGNKPTGNIPLANYSYMPASTILKPATTNFVVPTNYGPIVINGTITQPLGASTLQPAATLDQLQ